MADRKEQRARDEEDRKAEAELQKKQAAEQVRYILYIRLRLLFGLVSIL